MWEAISSKAFYSLHHLPLKRKDVKALSRTGRTGGADSGRLHVFVRGGGIQETTQQKSSLYNIDRRAANTAQLLTNSLIAKTVKMIDWCEKNMQYLDH